MKYIIGNWKMFPSSVKEAEKIFTETKKALVGTKRVKVSVCATFVFLPALLKIKGKTRIIVGAQNMHEEDSGAHTGEIAPAMLRSLGVEQVILGHSERRAMGEESALIAKKVSLAIKNGLTVVLCVGERARDESAIYFSEVREQVESSLAGFPRSKREQLIIAYEPVWAIGKSAVRPATPKDLEEMIIHIRRTLVGMFGNREGFAVPIIYGGSVDEKNAMGFLVEGKADGLLVGRASLQTKKFAKMIVGADALK